MAATLKKERMVDGEMVLAFVWGALTLAGMTAASLDSTTRGSVILMLWGSSVVGVPSFWAHVWRRRAAELAQRLHVERHEDGLHVRQRKIAAPVLVIAYWLCWFGAPVAVVAWGPDPSALSLVAVGAVCLLIAQGFGMRRRRRERGGVDAIVCGRKEVLLPAGPRGVRQAFAVDSIADLRIQELPHPAQSQDQRLGPVYALALTFPDRPPVRAFFPLAKSVAEQIAEVVAQELNQVRSKPISISRETASLAG